MITVSQEQKINSQWQLLKEEVKNCTKCSIRQQCTQTVFGAGYRGARIFVLGEAPGAEEDLIGKPFIGRAGQLLRRWLIYDLNFPPNDLFITNILKCRPPNNRDPFAVEKVNCMGYLTRQILLSQPSYILCIGRIAANTILHTNLAAKDLVGKWFTYIQGNLSVPLFTIYHPAFILRPNGQPYEKFTLDSLAEFKEIVYSRKLLPLVTNTTRI